jgi:hypothetical protein
MNHEPRSLGPKVFAVGLVVGLVAGWSGGCSKPGPTDVDVKKAKAALGKRWAGYGEIHRSRSRASDKTPVKTPVKTR